MSTDRNQEEWDMLRERPADLLLRYQDLISFTVSSLVRRGFFVADDKAEIIQEINLALLERKLDRILAHYDGSVYLRTYFGKVVYHLCLEHSRRQSKTVWLPEDALYNQASKELTPMQETLLQDETNRLDAILRMMPKSYKARLCLKSWARLLLQGADVQLYDTPSSRAALAEIKQQLFEPYDHLSELEVFELLVALFNVLEGKDAAADSLRRWTTELAKRVVGALNGEPPTCAYQTDTLKILLAYVEKPKA